MNPQIRSELKHRLRLALIREKRRNRIHVIGALALGVMIGIVL